MCERVDLVKYAQIVAIARDVKVGNVGEGNRSGSFFFLSFFMESPLRS